MYLPMQSSVKKYNRIIIACLALILAVGSLNYFAVPGDVTVTIVDDGNAKTVVTGVQTVEELLAAEGVVLRPRDSVDPALHTKLFFDATVTILRPTAVCLSLGSETKTVLTNAETVGDFLLEQGITLDETLRLEDFSEARIYEGKAIALTTLSNATQTDYETVPYNTQSTYSDTVEKGTTTVVRPGTPGTKTITTKIFYENGVEVNRIVTEEVTVEPVDEIVEIGTKDYIVTASGTHLKNAVRALDYTATAYCLKGICAGGMRSQVGVVAVDPRVIPLGTKLYIEAADGSWSYGFCIAGDTGGVIKGNIVDLYYDTYDECIQFGRRKAVVYVLED